MSHKKDPLEITGIEEIRLVDPDDYASRQARMHREAGRSDRAVSLELEREVCRVRPAKKRPARVPRDTEPCNLVGFMGIVAGGTAAAVIGVSLLGWAGKEAFDALAGIAASWLGVR